MIHVNRKKGKLDLIWENNRNLNHVLVCDDQISKHTIVNTHSFASVIMKTETFENPYAIFDHFSVGHKNNYNKIITLARLACLCLSLVCEVIFLICGYF